MRKPPCTPETAELVSPVEVFLATTVASPTAAFEPSRIRPVKIGSKFLGRKHKREEKIHYTRTYYRPMVHRLFLSKSVR